MTEWRKSEGINGGGPYAIWKSPKYDIWCVCDRNGVNILTKGTGEVFTDEKTAKDLVRLWNSH